ncbi:flagellar hook-associated protein FlgK [Ramlibacter sp.]|uniref:flagellar hook-associated protein FlgK n=1 Tax=Ramlibacter sp. TaxID=1917967 RepID=UPI002B538C90|nr:flagellar hook-associated protein FlgK [Ramlibacter sp.]HWI80409.1 flagellar hook-associated protein FlgK [Ramlibacter sp.]
MSVLFSTGLSGLNIARTALVTTAHNTANVYTEGYSRQKVVVESNPALATTGGFIGAGARVTTVVRSYDGFLSAQLSQAESSAQGLDAYANQIRRLDDLLADRTSGLSALMQGFFAGVQGVADTPADPAARQQLLSGAQALAGKFRSVDRYLTDLNGSLNEQIAGSVNQINGIATQVAALNRQISQLSGASGQPPNDLLDTRDKLLADLSKVVGVTVVQQDGGQYNVFIGSGHTLVLGDRAATVTAVASAADPTRQAVALLGANGNTTELKDADVSGGTLGGMLAFRGQALASAQNAIGRIATTLAASFNQQHRAGVDLLGQDGADFFSLAGPVTLSNGNNKGTLAVTATVTDASRLTTSDYAVKVGGTPGALTFSVTRLSDGQPVAATVAPAGADPASFTSLSFDGVTVEPVAPAGLPQPGDSFLVAPTRAAARDFEVAIGDPSRIAAGQNPGFGPADGRNALQLAALQRQALVGDGTTTFNGAYARLVSEVGNRAMEVQVAHDSQASLAAQVRASQQAVAGVNQDEETANLLMYQQMYQANAKVIQTASAIFDTILGLR